jgi:hypothetical protein
MAFGNVVKRDRLIRYQPGRRNRIPGGITPENFLEITRILTEVREDIDNELRALCGNQYDKDKHEPKEVHIRLNESDKTFVLPCFAGWVESDDVRDRRQDWNQGDPGLMRFGGREFSEIYAEALRYANHSDPKEHFRYRDWARNEIYEKTSEEKATDPKSGNTFQTCLAIVIDRHAVGTLVVGFRERLADATWLTKTQEILREWAREPKSSKRARFIDYLRNFELGGPPLDHSNWVDLL